MLNEEGRKRFTQLLMQCAGCSEEVIKKVEEGDLDAWKPAAALFGEEGYKNWDQFQATCKQVKDEVLDSCPKRLHKDMTDEDYKEMLKNIYDKVDVSGDGMLQPDEFKQFFVEAMSSANMPREAIKYL